VSASLRGESSGFISGPVIDHNYCSELIARF